MKASSWTKKKENSPNFCHFRPPKKLKTTKTRRFIEKIWCFCMDETSLCNKRSRWKLSNHMMSLWGTNKRSKNIYRWKINRQNQKTKKLEVARSAPTSHNRVSIQSQSRFSCISFRNRVNFRRISHATARSRKRADRAAALVQIQIQGRYGFRRHSVNLGFFRLFAFLKRSNHE